MLNKEVVQEFFVESPHRDKNGVFLPLPLVGELFLENIQREWRTTMLPKGQYGLTSTNPKYINGVEGYSVRKEIVFK